MVRIRPGEPLNVEISEFFVSIASLPTSVPHRQREERQVDHLQVNPRAGT
jgi:hypothetical protein